MTDRDWDKEMAKIDRQLASLSDDQLVQRTPMAPPANAKGKPVVAPQALTPHASRPTPLWGVYLRVGLAIALAAGIPFWPYAAACGATLLGYMAAIGVMIVAGVWASVSTWRARMARPHIASLLVIAWGASLAAREVLPRSVYATTAVKQVAWACK